MLSNNTDKEWEKLGRSQPYFGVISLDEYSNEKLDPETRARFFATGEEYIGMILDEIGTRVCPGFRPRTALDFGCGVGRLALPLASRCEKVLGLDVSESMLAEARKNATERGIGNATFRTGAEPGEVFDFVNTFIVLQHISLPKGLHIFQDLVARVAPGGCGAIHLTYHADVSRKSAFALWMRKRFQLANAIFNLAKGLPLSTPFMQMNEYDLNRVYWAIQRAGCTAVHSLFTKHGRYAGQILLFRRPSEPEALKA